MTFALRGLWIIDETGNFFLSRYPQPIHSHYRRFPTVELRAKKHNISPLPPDNELRILFAKKQKQELILDETAIDNHFYIFSTSNIWPIVAIVVHRITFIGIPFVQEMTESEYKKAAQEFKDKSLFPQDSDEFPLLDL